MAKREILEVPVVSEVIRRLGAPTSALVRSGNIVATCGMPPVDLETGDIVRGDIAAQTRASLEALRCDGGLWQRPILGQADATVWP